MEVAVKEEQEKENYSDNNSDNNFNMLLQEPCEFLEEVVRTILRCLGLLLDDCRSVLLRPTSSSTTTDAASSAADSGSSATMITTTTTTTIIDSGEEQQEEEKEETCLPSQTPDSGGADGGGDGGDDYSGTVADQPGLGPDDSTPVDAGCIQTKVMIRKPPRPGVGTGRGGQIH